MMIKPRLAASVTASVLAAALVVFPPLNAQETTNVIEVNSVLSRDAARAGTTIKAAVILKIQPGYHINDNAPLDEFMFPTSLSFDDHPALEVLEIFYPRGHAGRFAYAEGELIVYEGEATLGALIRIPDGQAPGDHKLKGTLSYQACDNVSCLPPREAAFEIPVTVVPESQATKDLHPEIFAKIVFRTDK